LIVLFKNIILITFFLSCGLALSQNRNISGIIKDSQTNELLGFCNIVVNGSKIGTNTNANGKFKIAIPTDITSPKLTISYIGYKTDTIQIIDNTVDYAIFLIPIQSAVNEIIVTGVSKATLIRENPVPIISISPRAMEQTVESNVIDVLVRNVPGLDAVKTGPNISKPFIRGLGYNRVLTLYDGVRQEGQQWGDEHGLEVDAYNIEKAEVIKGPSSLMYGSDALAGVVSLFPAMPKPTNGKIQGKFLSEYQSNNGLIGNGIRLMYGNNRWSYAIRGSYRLAKNYENSIDGRVHNTGFEEVNASGVVAYTSKKGYSNINFTLYDNSQGIPDGSRDSLTRKFTNQINEADTDDIKNRPVVSTEELNSYRLNPLRQHIQHYRVYSNNHYELGIGNIDAMLALQQNVRREYNHPKYENQAGLYTQLNTANYSMRYNLPTFSNIDISVGTNGMYQNNISKDATDFPIPNYNLFDVGSYAFAKWKHYRWTLSGGLRYDIRYLNGDDFYTETDAVTGFSKHVTNADANAYLQFPSFKKTFNGVSFSSGVTYQITDQIGLKINLARGYRSPSITEFASNGLDPGAKIVYLGNRNFKPEFSLQEDIGVNGNFNSLSFSVSIFNNHIENYIYLSKLVDAQGNPVIIVPGNTTYAYQQAAAQLYGAEAILEFHPKSLKGFSFNTNFSMINGFNRKPEYQNKGVDGSYLPFIPPYKLISSISQEIKTKSTIFTTVNMKVELNYNAAQNRFLALDNTETATKGYSLVNVAAGTEIKYAKNASFQLQMQVNNVFDVAYQSNLSRLKYFEYYSRSPTGRYGIYGMGRNICFKLIMPF